MFLPGDLLGAGDLQSLALLDGADELAGFEQESWVPVSSQAKPRPSVLDRQLPAPDRPVDVGDLELAARRRAESGRRCRAPALS